MFMGSMMAFLFCGLTMNAVGRAAAHMVDEVRRQFHEIKGILTGEREPDYERCVAISIMRVWLPNPALFLTKAC